MKKDIILDPGNNEKLQYMDIMDVCYGSFSCKYIWVLLFLIYVKNS